MSDFLLTDPGELSYGEVTFNGIYSSKWSGKPVYDDAGRTVKYVEWTLEVTGWISTPVGDESTNDALDTLKMELTHPGQVLRYTDKGFGQFVINEGGVWDVNWGPKPQLISFVPVGRNQTAQVTWRVTCCIPECDNAVYKRALMMACYEVDYDIDEDGYTTISTSGAIEIPLTYRQGRTVPETADKYRWLCYPPLRGGWSRKQKYKLSKDRMRLEFSFVDRQLPAPLPNNITFADVKHRVKSAAKAFVKWDCSITGTMRADPAVPRSAAWDRFMLVVMSRIRHTRSIESVLITGRPAPAPGFDYAINRRKPFVMITSVEFEEDVFGKDNRFTVNYTIAGGSLKEILNISGLWRPIPGTDYVRWADQAARSAQSFSGHAGATFNAADDTIVDLCNRREPRLATGGPRLQPRPPGTTPAASNPENLTLVAGPRGSRSNDVAQQFPPESSWLAYEAAIREIETDHLIRHKPLAGKVTVERPGFDVLGGAAGAARVTRPEDGLVSGSIPDEIQRITGPSFSVVLSGTAVRLAHQIQAPNLVRYCGRDVAQASRDVEQREVGSMNGVPIFALRWEITYLVPEAPRTPMPVLANPMYGTDGHK